MSDLIGNFVYGDGVAKFYFRVTGGMAGDGEAGLCVKFKGLHTEPPRETMFQISAHLMTDRLPGLENSEMTPITPVQFAEEGFEE